jgi:hypothetical protein
MLASSSGMDFDMRRLLTTLRLWILALPLFLIGFSVSAAMPQRPPAHITVDGKDWQVKVVECDGIPDTDWRDTKLCPYLGYTETKKHTVYILQGQELSDEKSTLLHELMHVAVGTDHSFDKTTIHGAIYTISNPLSEILSDNPKLLTYFGER